jgi:hypothetical protein
MNCHLDEQEEPVFVSFDITEDDLESFSEEADPDGGYWTRIRHL